MQTRTIAALLTLITLQACAGPVVLKGYLEPYRDGGLHPGLDLSGYLGEPVRAVRAGCVVGAGPELVVLEHDTQQQTVYYHVGSVRVQRGDCVAQGDQLAELALTGVRSINDRSTIGPGQQHLHLELKSATGRGQDPATLKMSCEAGAAWRWPVGCR